MQLVIQLKWKINEGALADIFLEPCTRNVYKLFLNGAHPRNQAQFLDCQFDGVRRLVFNDECRAYQIAAATEVLATQIPRFYGRTPIRAVVDGESVCSRFYLLDSCYCLEWITGAATKLHPIDELSERHLADIERRFHEAGILYTRDASIFNRSDPQQLKLIDFAMKHHEFEL